MAEKDNHLIKIVIAVSALLVGVALGHWGLPSPAPAPVAQAVPRNIPAEETTTFPSLVRDTADAHHLRPGGLDRILKNRRSPNRFRALTDYVNGLSSADLAAALLATRQLPYGADRDLATRLLVSRWAELDPEAALAFAAAHKGFDDLTGAVFEHLATDDVASALARAREISDPSQRYQAYRGALSVMAESDPAGAVRFASTLENFRHNEPLSQTIYRQWSSTDPLSAASLAAQDTSNSGWRSPLGQVVRTWAGQDPQGALNFATTISDPATQDRTVGDVVRRWSDQDPAAAGSWINGLPAGSVRDSAAAAYASSVSSTDLSAAVGWAQSITDQNARTAALQQVSRRVLRRDPTNGAATLVSAGVPATILQNLTPEPGH